MTIQLQALGSARRGVSSSGAVVPGVLSACLVAAFVFPADMVLKPIGAVGYVGMLLAIFLLGLWGCNVAFGLQDPVRRPSPARLGLAFFWLASIAAYLMAAPEYATSETRAAADRWLLTLAGMSGVVLAFNDYVRTLDQVARTLAALVWGATLCALVALYQFVTVTDPMDLVRSVMVGFTENGGQTTFQPRDSFVRVAGSTFHPIELGVVSSMVLPLAVWRALFDRGPRRRWILWAQAALIGFAAVFTVSRSAILSIAVVIVLFTPTLPRLARRWAIVVIPVCVAFIFVALPGFVTTITGAFGAGTRDPSLAVRVSDYPTAEAIVSRHPFFGIGPGAYVPNSPLDIFDNQYLGTAVTTGLVGLACYLLLLALALGSSLQVAWAAPPHSALRCLAGGVAAGLGVAALSSATFDSLSFPVFVLVLPVLVGLAGSLWNIAQVGAGDPVTVR